MALSPILVKLQLPSLLVSKNPFIEVVVYIQTHLILLRHHKTARVCFLGTISGTFWVINKQIVLSIYCSSVNTICQKMTERQNKAAIHRGCVCAP